MLRVLKTKKMLAEKRKALDACRTSVDDLKVREDDIAKAIEEAVTDEDMAVVEEAIAAFEAEKKEVLDKEADLNREVEALEKELADIESEQNSEPEHEEKKPEERKKEITMTKRNVFAQMSFEERNRIMESDGVKAFLSEMRNAIREKRAVTGVASLLPVEVLPLLRANIENYSKLYKHVNVKQIGGEGKQPVQAIPGEAVWTECCAILNELELGFNDWTVDCFKVGGYYAVCNANLEDTDIDLASEIITALGQGIGLALDKAIIYGRNTSANANMPQGIVPSLLQTAAPAGYPTTARAWADLHTSNVLTIASGVEGADLFKELIIDSAATSNNYARGELTWVMNDKTYKKLVAQSLEVNAAGALVAGVTASMPVVGGTIEVLNFIPDDVIVFGYFDLYLLGERAGAKFAESEHVRFLNDQTVFKGTARYDGAPIIREAFAAVGINGATVGASVTFPQDTANA